MLRAFFAEKTLMASFFEAVGESINRAACIALGNFATSLEVLNYVLDPLATAPSYNGAAALYAARCGLPLPDDYIPDAGFTGGQCAGVQYDVSYSYDFVSGITASPPGTTTPQSGTSRVVGKVGGVRAVNQEFLAFGELFGDFGVVNIGGGSSGFSNNVAVRNARISGIVRVDGQPDNCGNPPAPRPVYEPGSNVVNNNVTYINNEGDTTTIPVTIAFGYATFNANGTINIPVKLDFDLNPELNFNGEFNFSTGDVTIDPRNPSTPRPPTACNPDGFEPEPGIPAPPPEIPDAEPPETPPDEPTDRERVISAAIVTTNTPGANESVIGQDDNPDIYVPALGYVQFRIRVGSSSAWTNDIPVKSKRAFIVCPWPGGAVEVKGTGRFENVISVIPVYGTSQLQNPFPE